MSPTTNPLGLGPEQLAERTKHLHAGDATALMAGDYRKVWRRIVGLDPDDDLSGEFRVQLGSYTEPFNLYWTEKMTGREVIYFSDNPLCRYIWRELTGRNALPELQVSRDYPFMAVNLDAMSTTPTGENCVLDAKHLARSTEAEILRYTPAGVFQATVMGLDWWGIAPIVGNKWESPVLQQVDVLYQAQLIARARECWGFVERNEEPPELPREPTAPPKPQPKLRQIILDLTPEAERPNWAGDFTKLARTFAETDGAAKLNAITREEIKKLVPDDVGLVQLGLVKYKRDGRGQTVSMEKADG